MMAANSFQAGRAAWPAWETERFLTNPTR